MNQGRLLLTKMAETYHADKWLSMVEIIRFTEMSSFNQRFQEWRKKDVQIAHKTIDGKSYYKMETDPLSFDWDSLLTPGDTLKAVVPRQRIGRRGKKVERVETQETLTL